MSVWSQIVSSHSKLGSKEDLDADGNVVVSKVNASNDGEVVAISVGDRVSATTMGRMQKTHNGTVSAIKPTARGHWVEVSLDIGGMLLTRESLVRHL